VRLAAWLVVATIAVASLDPRAARAEPPRPKVAIVCARGDSFGLRVRAELESLGFDATLVDPDAEPASRVSLEAAARRVAAIAAIRAVPSAGGVEVWIADRVTGKTVLRQIAMDDAPSRDAADRDDALALRVVELLRASMLETMLPVAPPGDVPAPAELGEKLHVPAPARMDPPPPTLRLSVAPAVLLSPGGFGASASLDLALAWMPSEHVGIVVFGAIPLSKPEVKKDQGVADLSVFLVGGGARFLFTTRANRWVPSADVGLTAVFLNSQATTTNQGFAPAPASAATPAPFVRLGLAFAASPLVRVRVDILGGVVAQGVSVQFSGQSAATWGQPFVLPSVGVDFGWF
jgi:hypothetical protein